ncbi:lytic murein transglycosylase B [Spongorhabdus nitratireducens]
MWWTATGCCRLYTTKEETTGYENTQTAMGKPVPLQQPVPRKQVKKSMIGTMSRVQRPGLASWLAPFLVSGSLLVTSGEVMAGGTETQATAGAQQQVQQKAAVAFHEREDVRLFIDEMVREQKMDRAYLEKLFKQIEPRERIVSIMERPAEKRMEWDRYRDIFITDARIKKGVEFWEKYADLLHAASIKYGVPPEVIVGIIGVETYFGRQSGGFRVVDSLATLGFNYPRRAKFFQKELRELLILSREQGFDPLSLTGSYAGAMGIPQFMPSSFRVYAVDFSGNGRSDIWNDPADAIGSVANYLSVHGWEQGKPVASRAHVKGNFEEGLTDGPSPKQTVGALQKYGWKPRNILAPGAKATGLRFNGKNGPEYWVTLKNFYVITRYNRSNLYAMAVYQLGQEVKQAYAHQPATSTQKAAETKSGSTTVSAKEADSKG